MKQWVSITFILLTTNFHNIFEFKNTDLKFSRNFASFLTLFIATELLRTKLVCVHRVRSHRKFFYIYIHMLVVVLYEIFRTMFWIELICHRMRRIHRFCALAKVIHPKYSKQWSYILAAIMDYGCSKIMVNHGLFLSLWRLLWENTY